MSAMLLGRKGPGRAHRWAPGASTTRTLRASGTSSIRRGRGV